MTNSWTDIANSTCVIVWGANPAENHPACMAHINKARFPKQYFAADHTRVTNGKTGARLIVIDPRKTRTAMQVDESKGDRHIRIRPGTNIALQNGIQRYILSKMETSGATYADGTAIPSTIKTAFFNFLNEGSGGSGGNFYRDGKTDHADNNSRIAVPEFSKYTDARFLVSAANDDYDREPLNVSTPLTQISNIPKRAADCRASANGGNVNTVYERLRAHVAPYEPSVVADICGCTEADIAYVGDEMIRNGRAASSSNGTLAGTENRPEYAAFRATTILYAMGITQHTCGSQNIKGFANLQILMGNMGRCGGGINALRGIHNVQGSTDMGLLYGNIPAYSGNPTAQPAVDPNAFGKYLNALWGYPLHGTGGSGVAGFRTKMDGSFDDAYLCKPLATGYWQQQSFYAMTQKWFAHTDVYGASRRADVDKIFSLWPKGNGDNHIQMFRNMGLADGDAKRIRAAVVWGMNPAVTEPNQSAIRTGLKQLDLLVLSDMFETETVACDRRSDGVTFLFPAASHVEKAGSVTNSSRALQWRYKAKDPVGNTKDDTELLLRFAKALDVATAFSHIEDVWHNEGGTPLFTYTSVYDQLYGTPYGGFDGVSASGSTSFSERKGTGELANLRATPAAAVTYNTDALNLKGSEWVCESVFREMCKDVDVADQASQANVGTIWIYNLAYGGDYTAKKHTGQDNWGTYNRAKSRDNKDYNATLAYPGWGYSWLVNRRVLYNNGDCLNDTADYFMGPDSCARLYTSDSTKVLNYSRWYRTIHRLVDKPGPVVNKSTGSLHYVADPNVSGSKISYAGRFPGHTEPYESPRPLLAAQTAWGTNTKGTKVDDLIPADTLVGVVADFPLVLTTIRCVEHFQGGPTTRNNSYNVEAEPVPWIEINSIDARAKGISDGDWVNVITARSNSTTAQEGRTPNATAGWAQGFKARVGTGLQANQRVAQGVVAIPWHWGDQGLSTGSRANDLCIDASDANTAIPEYKACLCKIVKL